MPPNFVNVLYSVTPEFALQVTKSGDCFACGTCDETESDECGGIIATYQYKLCNTANADLTVVELSDSIFGDLTNAPDIFDCLTNASTVTCVIL